MCQIFALIFPIRQDPSQPISPTNCPTVDLCCPVRDIGFLVSQILMFAVTALAGLWQSWSAFDNGHCDPGWLQPGQSCASLPSEPYAFLDFVFCNELTPWELAHLPLTPVEQQQQAKCGKALPIITLFTEIISSCPCQFLALADAWLATYFHGFDCFCGPVNGFFTNLGDLTNAITVSVVTLFRRINDLSYWQPFGVPSANSGPNQFNEHDTWTWEFFGPIADALCNTLVALTCFLDLLLPFCTVRVIIQVHGISHRVPIVIRRCPATGSSNRPLPGSLNLSSKLERWSKASLASSRWGPSVPIPGRHAPLDLLTTESLSTSWQTSLSASVLSPWMHSLQTRGSYVLYSILLRVRSQISAAVTMRIHSLESSLST